VAEISLTVNGTVHQLELEPRTSLLDALREHIGLMGTKKGCNQGGCGACTVIADGRRIVSCLGLAVQYDGCEIVTVEGLDHPLQPAFVEYDAFQCGYCTSGQLCSAVAMLEEHRRGMPSHVSLDVSASPPLSRAEIQERMSGNLCRCGAYNGIVDAIAAPAGVQA
jgi:xanthine dehydrogenase YagT iron-sulfur-binding subunit